MASNGLGPDHEGITVRIDSNLGVLGDGGVLIGPQERYHPPCNIVHQAIEDCGPCGFILYGGYSSREINGIFIKKPVKTGMISAEGS